MADQTIEVTDDATVTVDLTGIPDLENQDNNSQVNTLPQEEEEVAPKPQKRQREQKVTNAAEEAATALNQAVKAAEEGRKTAEDARRAAEATALSERRRAEDASRMVAQKDQEVQSYREQAESRELSLLTTGIDSASRELASAQSELQHAMEAGDFVKLSAAQVKLSTAAAKLDRLESSKETYEANLLKRPATPTQPAPREYSGESQFDKYLANFDPVAQAWLRQHPECAPAEAGGDRAKNAKMMAGHYDAVAQGLTPNSTDYYRVIEEHTGHRSPISSAASTVQAGEEVDPTPQPARQAAPKPRQAQPSAPVSRDAPGPNGAPMSRQVTLSPAQQEIALISYTQKTGESEQDYRKRAYGNYASELVKAQQEGRIGRRFDNM